MHQALALDYKSCSSSYSCSASVHAFCLWCSENPAIGGAVSWFCGLAEGRIPREWHSRAFPLHLSQTAPCSAHMNGLDVFSKLVELHQQTAACVVTSFLPLSSAPPTPNRTLCLSYPSKYRTGAKLPLEGVRDAEPYCFPTL